MQLICISRGSYSQGKELAQSLARKLGYQCLSREELLEEATKRGIAVGKMEMAMIKPHTFIDRFAQEKEHYQALAASILCEKALERNLVYHGRTGHLLLPGIDNILRIRVVADLESRIAWVERELGLNRKKAWQYLQQVEEDRARWVRIFYNVNWDLSTLYDVTINTDHLSVENATSALCAVAELPEFQFTPASKKALQNMLLASRCRLALFDDDRTYELQAKVRADDGIVSVTYPPQQVKLSWNITEILQRVPGVREILCTVAQTNILWIQEKFDPVTTVLEDIVQIAKKWDAAVELIQMRPDEETGEEASRPAGIVSPAGENVSENRARNREYDGGIEEDIDENSPKLDEEFKETYNKLVSSGHAGGRRIVRGSHRNLLLSMDRGVKYSLVVVGDVFLSKGHAAQTRMTNELVSFLTEQLRIPVVLAGEIRQQYLFGKKQLLKLVSYAAVVALIYYLVFRYQMPVLEFSRLEGEWRVLSVALLMAFIPFLSYLWGTASKLLLKLLKFE